MKRNFPLIYQAVLLLLLGLVFTAMILGVQFFLLPEKLKNDLLVSGTLNAIPLALLVLIGYRIRGQLWGEVFPFAAPTPADIIFLLLTGIGLSIITSEVDNIFRTFFPVPEYIQSFFMNILTGQSILATLFLVSLMAPLTEEFFFRGIILKGFLENYSLRKAIFISSFFFALYHLNPWQFTGALVGGLVLGWIYYQTGSLFHAVLLHGIFNALPVLTLRTGLVIEGYSNPENLHAFQPLWFDLIGILFLAAGIFYFFKRKKREGRVT